MMQLKENKSQIWFKVIYQNGQPIDGSTESWLFPNQTEKGADLDFANNPAVRFNDGEWQPLAGIYGTWLISDPRTLFRSESKHVLYVTELLSIPTHELPGMIWVEKLRLVRAATHLDLKAFRLYLNLEQDRL